MVASPKVVPFKVDVRDLKSVRSAAREAAARDGDEDRQPGFGRMAPNEAGGDRSAGAQAKARSGGNHHVIIGDDWVSPQGSAGHDFAQHRRKRGLITLQRSPLARKIITFNLIALILLVAGMLWLTPSRENFAFQRANGLVSEAELVADVIEAQLPLGAPVGLMSGDGIDSTAILDGLDLRGGTRAFLFDTEGRLIAFAEAQPDVIPAGLERDVRGTLVTNVLNAIWDGMAGTLAPSQSDADETDQARADRDAAEGLVAQALSEGTIVTTGTDAAGVADFTVATPVMQETRAIGVVVVRSAGGEIDALVRREREQVLQIFLVGVLVSVGLSLVLASTIANPLADLAAAVEFGRDRNVRAMSPGRVRIPDLTARPDEIGRLSAALRGMVAALYDRIEANEQFAADVAHEIKNPLASLRSAVGTLHVASRDDQRSKLLDIIDHDVRRLDRLVSDISNASRLDSELVKEEEAPVDLLKLLGNLNEFLGEEARAKGIDFIADLPAQPITIYGLEGRLAQVFVNLITNAISFCEDGDAIRIWARKRENRVLIVVEDTGPGIPETALAKIFQRFYSERPEGQFGNNSGLGLAISKQIVEAHGGVIWAENIRPTEADASSDPLGARFVVGLPV